MAASERRLAIGVGAAALAPVGVAEGGVALGIHQVELALAIFPAQVGVGSIFGIIARDVERLPPSWVAAKPKNALRAGQTDGQAIKRAAMRTERLG